MTKLLEKAVSGIGQLPASEQDAIARELLDRIDADERWAKLLADPRSAGVLARLAAEAREDLAAGNVEDGDPGARQGK
jgi:hypothetical protein